MQRLATKWRESGIRIGFVPTMGYLHAGHLSLVATARQRVGKQGMVVVSVYVNPTQFGPKEDFSRYPRDLAADTRMCKEVGVDIVFAPSDSEMYPQTKGAEYSTYVVEEAVSRSMEGVSRPGHFRGVTTVVAKLFNIVQPHYAVFGAKDYQQATVLRRMTRDLNFPTRLLVASTLREKDGLAMSSRNKYLEGTHRQQALALSTALKLARKLVRKNGPIPSKVLEGTLRRSIERHPDARVDYIAFFKPDNLEGMNKISSGCHMAMAVYVGKTRLIDNGRL